MRYPYPIHQKYTPPKQRFSIKRLLRRTKRNTTSFVKMGQTVGSIDSKLSYYTDWTRDMRAEVRGLEKQVVKRLDGLSCLTPLIRMLVLLQVMNVFLILIGIWMLS